MQNICRTQGEGTAAPGMSAERDTPALVKEAFPGLSDELVAAIVALGSRRLKPDVEAEVIALVEAAKT